MLLSVVKLFAEGDDRTACSIELVIEFVAAGFEFNLVYISAAVAVKLCFKLGDLR